MTEVNNSVFRRLLKESEAAELLTLSARTMQNYRLAGIGPAFVKMGGKRVGYSESALREWADRNTRRSTSDDGKK